MRVENGGLELEKALPEPASLDEATLVVEKAPEGKIRVTSGSWDGEKVILKGQVLELRNVDERLHVARKTGSQRRCGRA